MIADIPMLMDMLTGDDSAELESLRLVRAGRAAKAGARAGRIFRLIRVIRLVRVFKLLKLASKLRKQREQGDRSGGKDVQAAQNRQNLSNVGLRMMEAIAMPIKLLQSNFVQRRRCISQSRVPGVPCASVVGTASRRGRTAGARTRKEKLVISPCWRILIVAHCYCNSLTGVSSSP